MNSLPYRTTCVNTSPAKRAVSSARRSPNRRFSKVFDATDDPFLTASEIAERLPVTRQGVYNRLEQMREKKLVDKRKTGARGAGWWATVAPRLAPDVAERAEVADRGDAVTLEELDAELDTA
ncbi:hypothetical protein BRC85_09400 [Halobacteriales archaeon QS_1_69_70]|nr:MAG: hypothetical protein BRC85_09400 [Halobacteriales archaeon QS_1_69_70]